jgi:hypothetical protein
MAFLAALSILGRIDLYGPAEERRLPWSQRMGRRDSRLYGELLSPRFGTVRKVMAWGFIIFASAFCVLQLLLLSFGNPS